MVSQHTVNYNLPQVQPTDKVNWFDLNPAFNTIDQTMKSNETAAEAAQNTADGNSASIANLTESLNNTIDRLTTQENKTTGLQQQVVQNTTHNNEQDTHLQKLDTEVAAIQNEIGGAGTGEGGITEDIANLSESVATLTQEMQTAQRDIATNADNIGNLTGLQTEDKANLVAAINESLEKSGQAGLQYAVANILALLRITTSIDISPTFFTTRFMTNQELRSFETNYANANIYISKEYYLTEPGNDYQSVYGKYTVTIPQLKSNNSLVAVIPQIEAEWNNSSGFNQTANFPHGVIGMPVIDRTNGVVEFVIDKSKGESGDVEWRNAKLRMVILNATRINPLAHEIVLEARNQTGATLNKNVNTQDYSTFMPIKIQSSQVVNPENIHINQ